MAGSSPPPCSGLSLTKYEQDKAIMFGGRSRDGIIYNDLYIFDFSNKVWYRAEIDYLRVLYLSDLGESDEANGSLNTVVACGKREP